jgi:type II secretory pathway component PulK
MRTVANHNERGIALIIVMIVIVTLSVLAAGFAYSMKVETKLARNSSFDSDMEMLGRSGVEYARWILSQEIRQPQQAQYTALNQTWNGGFETNEPLSHVTLDNIPLGPGTFTIRMVDMERKFNLSTLTEGNIEIFHRALELIGVDAADLTRISDSFLDWLDLDENKRINGAESDYYLAANPGRPYYSKNGRVDDVSELLLIQGITPEMYWGSGRTGVPVGTEQLHRAGRPETAFTSGNPGGESSTVGLVDLFTSISGAGIAVNVNTASADVLAVIPGMDLGLAHSIVDTRAGSDHVDGTDDDTPFLNVGELINVPGMDPNVVNAVRQYFTTRSFLFQVIVEAKIGDYKRRYLALVHRRNQQDIPILYFQWK